MDRTVLMINLGYEKRYIFAVPVPEWSTQHELVVNKSTSWIKYPSPKGWDWLKLLMHENYVIIGLSTPDRIKPSNGIPLSNGKEIVGTIIRSHIITNAEDFGIKYSETDVYLVLEMFFKE